MIQRESPFAPAREGGAAGGEPRDGAPSTGRRYRWDLKGRTLMRSHGRRLAGVTALTLADVLAAGIALAAGLLADSSGNPVLARWTELLPLTIVLVVSGQGVIGTYGAGLDWRRPGLAAFGAGLTVAVGAALALAYPSLRLSVQSGVVAGVALALLLALNRIAGEAALRECYRRGLFRRSVLLVASEEQAREVRRWLRGRGYHEFRVSESVAPPEGSEEGPLPFPEVGQRIEERGTGVVLVSRAVPEETFRAVAYQCFLHGAELYVVDESRTEIPFRVVAQEEQGLSRIELAVPRLQTGQVLAKRALDLLLSGTALLVLSPLYVAVALAVKLDLSGPVFFRQERLGRGGRRFRLLKFRSMVEEAEERLREDPELYRKYVDHDYKLPPDEDPRITRVGRFLRSTSLDELPQLLNVLKGDMSLVGPRPIVPPEVEEYGIHAPVLLGVKPGVTGYWQISGRSDVGYPERARWEIQYVENWSLWLDLKILLRTVPVVVRKIGAH